MVEVVFLGLGRGRLEAATGAEGVVDLLGPCALCGVRERWLGMVVAVFVRDLPRGPDGVAAGAAEAAQPAGLEKRATHEIVPSAVGGVLQLPVIAAAAVAEVIGLLDVLELCRRLGTVR
jgi:hypothetical protein